MSKLTVDQKNVKGLFQESKTSFLIPDYQRPYAWGEVECKTLWEDLFTFSFPNDDCDQFNEEDEYFLGPIVTFKNDDKKLEIIDGQQRLTTLMLLLRAFYNKLSHMKDQNSQAMKQDIEKCLWRANNFGAYQKDDLKIASEVATDNDKEEFIAILRDGNANNMKSRYAKNFKYFEGQIADFLNNYPSYFAYLPARILNNCVLLPIEAESQDAALRIFSTLNDRGKPLSDADIFKAQFYKFYKEQGKKDEFIEQWKALDTIASDVFKPISGTPLDELFTRYMYYERAKLGIKSSTTEALRKFYERDSYAIFKKPETLDNITTLAKFWQDVNLQDTERFSQDILRKLFVLNYAPNGMWTYLVTVYFMQNHESDGSLDDYKFGKFLDKITAFIWSYALTNPGVNSLRTPVYAAMLNIVNGQDVTFSENLFDETRFRSIFGNYIFSNQRTVTKAYIAWWAFTFSDQKLLSLESNFDIEHIYPKARQQKEGTLKDNRSIELLGNKSLLEKRINIRASDYRFSDKKKYYTGFTTPKGEKKPTEVVELIELADQLQDFTEADIETRNKKILDRFIEYLKTNNLIASPNQ
ncbi:MAG: DUF262 domain-containing protein [Bacteroides sp.]|nr:DUF262 domain-containing protein [Bacteroides sp.]